MMIKKITTIITLMFLTVFLLGCSTKKETHAHAHIVIATLSKPIKHLYFSGVIQPINTLSVFSPIEGNVQSIHFVYGQSIKQGQLLLSIHAITLMDELRSAVSAFLVGKTAYLTQEKVFQGSRILYHAGVIDQDAFQSEQVQYDHSMLDYFEQKNQLKKIMIKAHINSAMIDQLTIADMNTLFGRVSDHINIIAPMSGIVLLPTIQNQSPMMTVGATLHDSQFIVSIGNVSGFAIDMDINEVDSNNVHPGMKALVSGDAFSGVTMTGIVSYVASQAQRNQDNPFGLFKAIVQVAHLSPDALLHVHVGMTAKVDIPIVEPSCLLLPIHAVFQKNGRHYVTVIDASGHQQAVVVITGNTTLRDVTILRGIQAGQRVVIQP